MTENLTRKHYLVQEITNQSWLANPVGKQGYEIVLLKKVGESGARYYSSLKPGQTLHVAERLLTSYIALQVDMRHARAFQVSGTFNTRDRNKKVSLILNVRFHVSDARIVAIETVDPLAELQSKVIVTLNRELQGYAKNDVSIAFIEHLVQNIGQVHHLGLTVEDVEVVSVEEDDVHHSIRQKAELEARKQAQEEAVANLEVKINKHNEINLSDLNVFMHEFPELTPQILATFSARELKLLEAKFAIVQASILNYIEQQKELKGEIDPREFSNILRDVISETNKHNIIQSVNGKDVTVIVDEPPTPPKDNLDLQTDLNNKNYKVSISFPLLLSKRFDSVFLFQLYLPEHRSRVNRNIKAQFQEKLRIEFVDQSIIKIGQKIQVEFYSSHLDFSKPVIKLVDGTLTKIVFLGSPKDTCQSGTQNVRVSISDVETQQEIESFNLEVRVVDFAFDHISRPLLSRVSAVVLGIGSFAMFLLTLLEQIDKTVGLTSGTAAGVLAAVVYANFYNLYQRMRPSSP